MDVSRASIYRAIDDERAAQADRWGGPHDWGRGDCSSPDVPAIVKAAVLTEECGEVARAVLEHDTAGLRAELVQVAALAIAWMEDKSWQ